MTEVFELTYHGGGGFTYTEVWNMDVPKRRFNLHKINEHLERIEELRNQGQKKLTEKTDPKSMQVPDFVANKPPQQPSFVSKVKSKK